METEENPREDQSEPTNHIPDDNSPQIEIARLSTIITNQTNEISELNNRVNACQQHYEGIICRMREEYSREKQSTVMRYAQAEKAKLDSDKRGDVFAAKNAELTKEKDNLQMKLSELKLMNSKLQQGYENKLTELTNLKKDFEKLKELNQSIDATLKSTLNHLKGESAQLKDQKEFNEKLRKDLVEQHQINDQLTSQCKQLTESKILHSSTFIFISFFQLFNPFQLMMNVHKHSKLSLLNTMH